MPDGGPPWLSRKVIPAVTHEPRHQQPVHLGAFLFLSARWRSSRSACCRLPAVHHRSHIDGSAAAYPAPRLQPSPRRTCALLRQRDAGTERHRLGRQSPASRTSPSRTQCANRRMKVSRAGPLDRKRSDEWAAPLRFALLLCLLAAPALAAVPPDLRAFTYRQQLGASHPARKRVSRIRMLVRCGFATPLPDAPTILALGYFNCPNLCGVVRADLYNALGADGHGRRTRLHAHRSEHRPHGDQRGRARGAVAADTSAFPLPGAAVGWRFLTGRRRRDRRGQASGRLPRHLRPEAEAVRPSRRARLPHAPRRRVGLSAGRRLQIHRRALGRLARRQRRRAEARRSQCCCCASTTIPRPAATRLRSCVCCRSPALSPWRRSAVRFTSRSGATRTFS